MLIARSTRESPPPRYHAVRLALVSLLLALAPALCPASAGPAVTVPPTAGPASTTPAPAGPSTTADALFQRVVEGREGCCIVMDARSGAILFEAGGNRCLARFLPCSTFKIPLALMAFDQQVITPETHFTWDGTRRALPGWNHDQTPLTWMRESVVWVSQQLAHQLGRATMERYLARFAYGNRDMSAGLDHAWLGGGSLTISALEQVRFLSRLWTGRLPLRAGVVEQVEAILLRDDLPSGSVLLGKTGTGIGMRDDSGRTRDDRQLGWFVGCAKKDGQLRVFALNITERQSNAPAGPMARGLARRLLKELGYL